MFQYNTSEAGAYLHNQEYTLDTQFKNTQETALCTYNIFTWLQACTLPMNYYYYAT